MDRNDYLDSVNPFIVAVPLGTLPKRKATILRTGTDADLHLAGQDTDPVSLLLDADLAAYGIDEGITTAHILVMHDEAVLWSDRDAAVQAYVAEVEDAVQEAVRYLATGEDDDQ